MSQAALALAPSELVIDRYRPLRPLGSGGSGSVWLARDETTGLEVALKMVPREGKAAFRAEREAETAAKLRHERCLRAYGFGHDEHHVYIAYEYVPGRTLRQALRAGQLDDRAVVEAAAQILDGLAHAHARGIVHRDVKPSNVQLVEGEGSGVSIRILDFGLAQVAQAETLTAHGDVPGTLAYISPERLRGITATAAADVWAVGVLLWESLAGWHPFWTSSLLETAKKIQEGAPPLSTARPDLPERLRRAVDDALDLDPEQRPAATDLAAMLRLAYREREQRRKPKSRAAARAQPAGGASRLPALVLPGRVAATGSAALAALATGSTTLALPFFPSGFPFAIAAIAAALMAWRPRAGLAFTLAVPILPLGNASLGLAIVYAVLALAWLALYARNPRSGLAAVAGPLLGPLGALGLLPLLLQPIRSRAHRALAAIGAVLLAAIAAGVTRSPLPFTGAPAPALSLDGDPRPLAVAQTLAHLVSAQHALLVEAAVLAAAAVLLPVALRLALPGIALWGVGLVAFAIAPARGVHTLPLVATTLLACICLGLWREPKLQPTRLRERAREHGRAVGAS